MKGIINMTLLVLTMNLFWTLTQGVANSRTPACRSVTYNVQTLHQSCWHNDQVQPIGRERSGEASPINFSAIQAEIRSLHEKQNQQDVHISFLAKQLQKNENQTGVLREDLNAYKEAAVPDFPSDCQQLKKRDLESGYYKIDLDGNGGLLPFKVMCNMSHTPPLIIVEHNYANRTEVKDAPGLPTGKTYNVTYDDISQTQLIGLTQRNVCRQFLRYDCHGSLISHSDNDTWAYWVDRNGRKVNYWPGGVGYGCACGITKTCAGGTSDFCECEKNDLVWRFDEGTISDDTQLPVKSLFFSDTNDSRERGFFTLGPLICY